MKRIVKFLKYFYWKHIKRLDVVGFYDGIPIMRTNTLEEERDG